MCIRDRPPELLDAIDPVPFGNHAMRAEQGCFTSKGSVSYTHLDVYKRQLVFFVGTYATSGVSHVGLYVGDGMMLHCGDPIQYSNLNTSYWQSHFYAYGRPPYN